MLRLSIIHLVQTTPETTTERVWAPFQVVHVALSLWFWGQVLNLVVLLLLLHYTSTDLRDSVIALLQLMPPPSPPWQLFWVQLGSGCWPPGSPERGRSVRWPTPQTDTPEEREETWLMLGIKCMESNGRGGESDGRSTERHERRKELKDLQVTLHWKSVFGE